MKSLLKHILGIGLLMMSETSTASAASSILFETSQGQVEVKLLPDIAPNHVARISQLVSEGFYDGIVFHRVIPGFMAQSGDPTGTGMGGSGVKLDAEFSDYEYRYGTVGMARSMSPNSADSQFFIMFERAEWLDGQYTIWGEVVDGIEHIMSIKRGAPGSGVVNDPDKIVSMKIAADVK